MADPDSTQRHDALHRAILWLNEQEGYSLEAIQVATERFGLTPQDQQYLVETLLPGADE